MNTTQLAPFVSDNFSCTPSLARQKLSIEFTGSGDMHAMTPLSEYLKRTHEVATNLGLLEVACDFRKLTFMNSSCFKAFVVWIDSVKNLPAPYKIRFQTDPTIHWQRRSLEALRRLAINVVTLEG
ncbi:MAG TPA: hypothetical protein VGI10_27600 [Polyangiaceae bacterium]|jgi:hypothetical protein